MTLGIGRGFAEVQILKKRKINYQLLEHFDMHLSVQILKKSIKKRKKERKRADTLRYHIFVFNIGSAILHFRM